MNKKTSFIVMVSLLIVALACSVILFVVPTEAACSVGVGESSCLIVQTSQYETTFGINNALIGIVAFSVLLFLLFLEKFQKKKWQRLLIRIGLVLGSIYAIYFLVIQFFILHAICKYCIVIDLSTLTVATVYFLNEKNNFFRS